MQGQYQNIGRKVQGQYQKKGRKVQGQYQKKGGRSKDSTIRKGERCKDSTRRKGVRCKDMTRRKGGRCKDRCYLLNFSPCFPFKLPDLIERANCVCVEDYLFECYEHGKNVQGYLVQGQFIKASLQDADILG